MTNHIYYGCFVQINYCDEVPVLAYANDNGEPDKMMPFLRSLYGLDRDALYACLECLGFYVNDDNPATVVDCIEQTTYRYCLFADSTLMVESNHITMYPQLLSPTTDLEPFKNGDSDDINPRWLSLSQACRYASMSDKTLLRYILNRRIYGTLRGGKWYLDKESIDRFFLEDDAVVRNAVDRILRRLS